MWPSPSFQEHPFRSPWPSNSERLTRLTGDGDAVVGDVEDHPVILLLHVGDHIEHRAQVVILLPFPSLHPFSLSLAASLHPLPLPPPQMKLTFLLLFLPFFFLLTFLLPPSCSADYHNSQNCHPKSCGGLPTSVSPSGYVGSNQTTAATSPFELHCEGNTAKSFMAEEDYRVLAISYENRATTVSMSRFSAMDENCLLLPYNNLSFALTPFFISSINRKLVFVHNCTAARAGALEISCHDNRNFVYLGGQYHES